MKNREQNLPLFTPKVWERMESSQKNQVIRIMAEMIRQTVQNKTREDHNYGLTARSENN